MKITIQIEAIQTYEKQREKIKQEVKGILEKRQNATYIYYPEEDKTITTIVVMPEEIRLEKNTYTMQFSMKEEYQTNYPTLYGTITMKVKTKEIKVERKGEQITQIYLCYDMTMDTISCHNEMIIKLIEN